jgi:small subunit ribosomal protein S17
MTTANPNHAAPQTPAPVAPSASARLLRRTLVGVVTSDVRAKTRTVSVAYQVRHAKYGKYLRYQTKYQVHDPENASHLGDRVEIANCRPISKTKTWRLVRVVEKSAGQIEHVTEVKTD